MDPLTHALASYTLKRSAFPRVARSVTLAILAAGTIADLDLFSSFFSPATYLMFCRTYLHSLAATLLISLLVTVPFFFLPENQVPRARIFTAALAAALLHLLLDLCQSSGVELLWPFSTRRFALDWVAQIDLWICGILLAGVFLPFLSGLVTEEIGAHSKGPQGRLGASVALVAVILYLVVRLVLHADAMATMESRTYRGESPQRVAAFAEPVSPFRWHGIIETESALYGVDAQVGPASNFDSDSAIASYKPQGSPAIDAARNSRVVRRFLQVARFPKASVEITPEGFHVIVRDFAYPSDGRAGWHLQALIDTDLSGKILSQELAWDPASRQVWWK